uniref:Granulins domain-containing protein n=1 Tax=Arcella intermedia TaxID=1963864 RepID=A0A6B2LHH4_9EUKA
MPFEALRNKGLKTTSCPANTCDSGQTCCDDGTGYGWNCCIFTNGACCSDHIHCCPSGYTCDITGQQCLTFRDSPSPPHLAKLRPPFHPLRAAPAEMKKIELPPASPDPSAASGCGCPTGTTCCLTPQGTFGCCPYVDAICCPDRVNCCPSAYFCDAGSSSCVHQYYKAIPFNATKRNP